MDIGEFKARTVMPDADVDAVQASHAGFIALRLASTEARMNSLLTKRYAVPFAAPVPEVFNDWLVLIVTPEVYDARGWNPSDLQSQRIIEKAAQAWAEIERAANSDTGLFELPLRQNSDASGVVKGGPFSSSEASPYDWTDRQIEAVEAVDRS
jgi:hypothetical protein